MGCIFRTRSGPVARSYVGASLRLTESCLYHYSQYVSEACGSARNEEGLTRFPKIRLWESGRHILVCASLSLLDASIYGFIILRGTKQQDAGSNDLGAVSAALRTASTNVIQVELTSDSPQQSPDALYDEALNNLRTRKPVERSAGDFHTERVAASRDYYANIRTNVSPSSKKAMRDHGTLTLLQVLLVWVLSNVSHAS
jgi:hypothetical protein